MNRCSYRELERRDTGLLGAIDRSERIEAVYRCAGGVLRLEAAPQNVRAWDAAELAAYTSRLTTLMEQGGRAHGAWDGALLVGVGALDVAGVGGDRSQLRLDLLYVSAAYRGRGIGRALLQRLAAHARSLGATRLYISATPTRGTVDTYLHLGARLVERADPELFAREPEDIHLCLCLR